jgi:hypothetical protein
MNLLNEVRSFPFPFSRQTRLTSRVLTLGCCEQYGVPTPKSKAAFSAAEAKEVAQNFGQSKRFFHLSPSSY